MEGAMPFTRAEFFDLFARYNEAVWPVQLALLMVGFAALIFAAVSTPRASMAAGVALAALWFWMGLVYHLAFFTAINPAASLFGAAFVIQGVLIIAYTVGARRLEFHPSRDAGSIAGAAIVCYALIAYPLIGYLSGHRYPAMPTFGVPCPTTIFTLGVLLLVKPPLPRILLVVPALWAAIGMSAALSLGVHEDLGLPVSALIVIGFTIAQARASTRNRAALSVRRGESPARP
jgi:hypothetical protein